MINWKVNNMKKMKVGLRIWIATVSVFSFLFGWSIFAHSAKPASLLGGQSQPAAAAYLAPLPTLVPLNNSKSGAQSIQPQQQTFASIQPRLRTGGS
jgi:hypothetical protein